MIALGESFFDRAAQSGVVIQRLVQLLRLEAVGQLLRRLPVLDADEGIVGQRKADPFGTEPPGEPAVPVAVELQPKRAPRRHPQITQPHHRIDEVEVVVQALARVGLEKRPAARLVVPGLVARASLHRRNHMHQSRMIAAPRDHLRYHVLLADMRLGKVLDLNPCCRDQFRRAGPDRVAQRLGKARIIENPNAARRKKACHPRRVTRLRQRPRHHHPVIAGEHSVQTILIPFKKRLRHQRPHPGHPQLTLSCLVPAQPG